MYSWAWWPGVEELFSLHSDSFNLANQERLWRQTPANGEKTQFSCIGIKAPQASGFSVYLLGLTDHTSHPFEKVNSAFAELLSLCLCTFFVMRSLNLGFHGGGGYHSPPPIRVRGQPEEEVLSLHHVGSRDWTQVVRFGSRLLCSLNHLTSLLIISASFKNQTVPLQRNKNEISNS